MGCEWHATHLECFCWRVDGREWPTSTEGHPRCSVCVGCLVSARLSCWQDRPLASAMDVWWASAGFKLPGGARQAPSEALAEGHGHHELGLILRPLPRAVPVVLLVPRAKGAAKWVERGGTRRVRHRIEHVRADGRMFVVRRGCGGLAGRHRRRGVRRPRTTSNFGVMCFSLGGERAASAGCRLAAHCGALRAQSS